MSTGQRKSASFSACIPRCIGSPAIPAPRSLRRNGTPLEGPVGQLALGLLASLLVELVDDRVDLGVQPLGGVDRGVDQLGRARLPVADQLRLRGRVEAVEVSRRVIRQVLEPDHEPLGHLADLPHGEHDPRHEAVAVDRVVADRERLALAAEDDLLVGDQARAGGSSGSARGRCLPPPRSARRSASPSPTGRRACGRGGARRSRTRACARRPAWRTASSGRRRSRSWERRSTWRRRRPRRPSLFSSSRSNPVAPTTAWTPASTALTAFSNTVSGVENSTITSAPSSASSSETPELGIGLGGDLHPVGGLDRLHDRRAHAPGGAGDGDADHVKLRALR